MELAVTKLAMICFLFTVNYRGAVTNKALISLRQPGN